MLLKNLPGLAMSISMAAAKGHSRLPWYRLRAEEWPATKELEWAHHSDKLVPLMRQHGLKVEDFKIAYMGHCRPLHCR